MGNPTPELFWSQPEQLGVRTLRHQEKNLAWVRGAEYARFNSDPDEPHYEFHWATTPNERVRVPSVLIQMGAGAGYADEVIASFWDNFITSFRPCEACLDKALLTAWVAAASAPVKHPPQEDELAIQWDKHTLHILDKPTLRSRIEAALGPMREPTKAWEDQITQTLKQQRPGHHQVISTRDPKYAQFLIDNGIILDITLATRDLFVSSLDSYLRVFNEAFAELEAFKTQHELYYCVNDHNAPDQISTVRSRLAAAPLNTPEQRTNTAVIALDAGIWTPPTMDSVFGSDRSCWRESGL